ncbi:MAG: HK97-gp10 family putative phage morphogenesis protein [Blautia sp.]
MSLKMTGFDLLEDELKKYDDPDDIAAKVVDTASPILVETVKEMIKATTSSDSSGDLADSIQATGAKINGYGCFAAVRPTGRDRKGVRNGEKMAYREYGTSKQPAKPILKKAVRKSEKKCLEIMQKTFEDVTK